MRAIRSATAATMLAAGLLLAAGGTAAAQDSDIESTDFTEEKPAVVQDVAESVAIEDSLKNIQVGLVNVQDLANRNETPVNAFNQNDIISSTEAQGGAAASSADNGLG
jgi:cysteine sulfinate desulfinase/cysteine desulfurase-like protein